MKKTILSLAAAAVITGAAGTNAHAENVKVKSGDTLWKLAEKYEVSVQDIKTWNQLSSDTIHPQQMIKVSKDETYTIQTGDTLWSIAHKFGVTVEDVKKWNNLNSDMIYPNEKLSIMTNQPVNQPKQNNSSTAEQASVNPQPAQKQASQPAEQPAKSEPQSPAESSQNEAADTISVRATGYTADCEGCSGVTATGVDLKADPDAKVISVDPSVIPLGSKVYVEGYGYATAADTGGAIKGNRIDIFFANEQDALNWGSRQIHVKVLN